MKVVYDQDVDVLRILFNNSPVEESDEDKPGVVLDYDSEGNIVGIEVLDASKRMENPRVVDYVVRGGLCRFVDHQALDAVGLNGPPGPYTRPTCPRCRSAWSTSTSAIIASTMGTARGRTQGSWRPLPSSSVGLP